GPAGLARGGALGLNVPTEATGASHCRRVAGWFTTAPTLRVDCWPCSAMRPACVLLRVGGGRPAQAGTSTLCWPSWVQRAVPTNSGPHHSDIVSKPSFGTLAVAHR